VRRGLGWIPDRPRGADETPDVRYAATRTAPPPPAHSLDALVLDVLDQGQLSSCQAHAGMQAIRMRHFAQGIASPPLGSRLFAYYAARAGDAYSAIGVDVGASIRSLFEGIGKLGFCPETVWPYSDHDVGDPSAPFRTMPSTAAFRAAHDQLGTTGYRRIASTGNGRIVEIKQALVEGFPVVFGCGVSSDFCDAIVDGTTPLPPPSKVTGQHAMTLIGYAGDVFTVLNSWGEGWGSGGRCLFSPEYVAVIGDAWIVEHTPPPEMA